MPGSNKRTIKEGKTLRQKVLVLTLIGMLAVAVMAAVTLDINQATAKPAYGSDCAKCHGVANPTAAPGNEPAKEPAPAKEQPVPAPAKSGQPAPQAAPATTQQVAVTCGDKSAQLASVSVDGNTLVEARKLAELISGTVA